MRGKQGDVTTIWGDMWYDYAKVFQSLSEYDEIMLDRRVNNGYCDAMMGAFAEEVVDWSIKKYLNMIKVIQI
jgi:hypothetical protein